MTEKWVKPEYCMNKDLPCEMCSFFWPQEQLCSLIPDEELTNTILRKKREVVKMKKLSAFLVILFVFTFVSLSFAGSYSAQIYPSTDKTADAVILAAKGAWRGIAITTDGVNQCVVRLYDNASAASGTYFWTHTVDTGSKDTKGVMLPFPYYVDNGIYADVTTSGVCTFSVHYQTYQP